MPDLTELFLIINWMFLDVLKSVFCYNNVALVLLWFSPVMASDGNQYDPRQFDTRMNAV